MNVSDHSISDYSNEREIYMEIPSVLMPMNLCKLRAQ